MRIALYDNLHFSGGKRQEFEMARTLIRHGHSVDLWTTTDADSAFLDWTEVTERQHVFSWPEPMKTPRRLPGLRGYFVMAATLDRIRRVREMDRRMAAAIDREGYDLVLAHHCPLVQAPHLLRFLHTPSIYFCGEPARDFFDPPIPRPYLVARSLSEAFYRRWYAPANAFVARAKQRAARENIKCATLVMTNSHFTAEAIYRAYGRHARVCYLGVDGEVFRPVQQGELGRKDIELPLHFGAELATDGADERRSSLRTGGSELTSRSSQPGYVLSVGEVKPHKGFDFLIEALGRLPVGVRPRLLLVANTVDQREELLLRDLARRHEVDVEIRCLAPDGELARLYAGARAFIYAPVLEPFGLAAIEAMACGTPVVGVAEGGVRESVRHEESGLLSERDPVAFARALERVLRDEALRARLATGGIEAVRRFWNWDAMYERFMVIVGDMERSSRGGLMNVASTTSERRRSLDPNRRGVSPGPAVRDSRAESLHVVLANQWYPPEGGWGGTSTYAYHMAHALSARGHRVTIVTAGNRKEAPRLWDGAIEIRRVRRVIVPFWMQRVPVVRKYARTVRHVLYSGRVARYLRRIDREASIDVIEFPEVNAEGLVYTLLRRHPPVVIRCHTPHVLLKTTTPVADRTFDYDFIWLLERLTIRHADAVTAPSSDLARRIAALVPGAQPAVVPNPVDVQVVSQPITHNSQPTTNVLHVGRLDRAKGIFTLAQAIPLVAAEVPHLRVTFAGEPRRNGKGESTDEELSCELRRLGCLDCVTIAGYVEEDRLEALYREADICVVPSELYESFSYTCARAMAAGKPVVATRIGGIPEVVADGETGILVGTGDYQALARAIIRLAHDGELRCRMGSAGIRRVQKCFSPSIVAEAGVADYRRAIAARAAL